MRTVNFEQFLKDLGKSSNIPSMDSPFERGYRLFKSFCIYRVWTSFNSIQDFIDALVEDGTYLLFDYEDMEEEFKSLTKENSIHFLKQMVIDTYIQKIRGNE